MRKNSSLITILAFGLYFLVGAGALLVGSSLTQLIGVYGRTMDAVVLLGSSFAIGRVSTVGLTGRLVEKIGAKAVYAISVLATCVYFVGIPLFPNYYAGMAAAFLGGVGMGAALVVTHIFNPGRHMVGLGPDGRVFQVPHQRPLARAVADADAPPLAHGLQEFGNVALGDLVVDENDDGTTAGFEVER